MADEPEKNQRLELRYRAGREDMRPKSDADLGCAIVFSLIALVMLLGIAVIVALPMAAYHSREHCAYCRAGIVCCRFDHRSVRQAHAASLVGNRDWKEDWRLRAIGKRAAEATRVMIE